MSGSATGAPLELSKTRTVPLLGLRPWLSTVNWPAPVALTISASLASGPSPSMFTGKPLGAEYGQGSRIDRKRVVPGQAIHRERGNVGAEHDRQERIDRDGASRFVDQKSIVQRTAVHVDLVGRSRGAVDREGAPHAAEVDQWIGARPATVAGGRAHRGVGQRARCRRADDLQCRPRAARRFVYDADARELHRAVRHVAAGFDQIPRNG